MMKVKALFAILASAAILSSCSGKKVSLFNGDNLDG